MDIGMWKELDKYSVKRKDGGDYIAFADVEPDFDLSRNSRYSTCGDMTRTNERYSTVAWQFDTYYDSRSNGWRDSLSSDFDSLYEHISGRIKRMMLPLKNISVFMKRVTLRKTATKIRLQ